MYFLRIFQGIEVEVQVGGKGYKVSHVANEDF